LIDTGGVPIHIVIDALVDTGKMVPLLFVIYVLIGFLEYRYKDRLGAFVARLGIFSPVAGAIFGSLPQCGFSVIISALYVKRLVSVGTLLAVYLSTSDEAIPVLLSMPWEVHVAVLLIVIKVAIAIIAGIGIDLLIRNKINKGKQVDSLHIGKAVEHHPGCCDHEITKERSVIKALMVHPLWHTLKIFLFLFILTVCLNFIIHRMGAHKMSALFLPGTMFQPVLAALIGLIPNCFTSVFLVQLFVNKVISLGALIAGLCSASGLGLLVLVKENKEFKDTLFIIALLVSVSIFAGISIQFLGK